MYGNWQDIHQLYNSLWIGNSYSYRNNNDKSNLHNLNTLKCSSKCFTDIVSLNPHDDPMSLDISYYYYLTFAEDNTGLESQSALFKVIQLEETEPGFQAKQSDFTAFRVNVALLQCISLLKQFSTIISNKSFWEVFPCPVLYLSILPFSLFSPIP